MNEWNGNAEAFRTYFHGKLDGGKGIPAEKVKGMPGHPFSEVCHDDNFGAVLNDGYADISFDSPELSDAFWNMAAANNWDCLIFENSKNGHIHSIWKKTPNWKFKDGSEKKLACGLVADIHSGSTYIRLRDGGVDRFPPLYEPEHIQEVPEELYPVKTNIDLWGLVKGDGRNESLFRYAYMLRKSVGFSPDVIRRILDNANKYVFSDELDEQEMNSITRPEALDYIEPDGGSEMQLVRLNEVEVREIGFLYRPQIPKGKIVIIGAHPGTGKTFIACYLASCISRGRPFFGIAYTQDRPGKVIYITTEDGIADTIVPRLLWCGADLNMIYTIDDPKGELKFSNIDAFDRYLDQVRPAMMILDPFQSFLGGKVDGNSANEIRALLNPVIALAEKYDTTIVFICHYNKNNHGDAITRILGSMDTMATARSYLALGNVPGDQNGTKYMSHEKSSTQAAGQTILFRIDPENGGVVFAGTSNLKQSDYSALDAGRKDDTESIFEAKMLISENLVDGRCEVKEIKELAKANRISERTLQRARADMQLKVVREGFGKESKCYWEKPKYEAIDPDQIEEDIKKYLDSL